MPIIIVVIEVSLLIRVMDRKSKFECCHDDAYNGWNKNPVSMEIYFYELFRLYLVSSCKNGLVIVFLKLKYVSTYSLVQTPWIKKQYLWKMKTF